MSPLKGMGFALIKENQTVKEGISKKVDLGNSMINILQAVYFSL